VERTRALRIREHVPEHVLVVVDRHLDVGGTRCCSEFEATSTCSARSSRERYTLNPRGQVGIVLRGSAEGPICVMLGTTRVQVPRMCASRYADAEVEPET
jgi:hypothetical protein